MSVYESRINAKIKQLKSENDLRNYKRLDYESSLSRYIQFNISSPSGSKNDLTKFERLDVDVFVKNNLKNDYCNYYKLSRFSKTTTGNEINKSKNFLRNIILDYDGYDWNSEGIEYYSRNQIPLSYFVDKYGSSLTFMIVDLMNYQGNYDDLINQSMKSIIDTIRSTIDLNNLDNELNDASNNVLNILTSFFTYDFNDVINDSIQNTNDVLSAFSNIENQLLLEEDTFNFDKLTILTDVPMSDNISEPPPTPDKAEYLQIIAKQTRKGSAFIIDDTDDNERVLMLHKVGSYHLLMCNGDDVSHSVRDKIEIIDANRKIIIKKDKIEIVQGSYKIEIRQNNEIHIHGDQHVMIEKNKNLKIKKNYNEHVDNDKNIYIKNDLNTKIQHDKKEFIDNDYMQSVYHDRYKFVNNDAIEDINHDYNLIIGNDSLEIVGNNKEVAIGGDYHFGVQNDSNEEIQGNLSITIYGQADIYANNDINIESASNINIRGSIINLN